MSGSAIILLAEDDEDHVVLIRHAFAEADLRNPLYVVWNGEEAIAYLQGTGKYSNRAEYPCRIFCCSTLKCRAWTVLESSPGYGNSRVWLPFALWF
jgi:hypothetical protein